jgi:uncharacterized integral membrane protein
MSANTTGRRQGFGARLRAVPWRVWLAVVITVLALVFIVQNHASTAIYLLQITVHAPMWVALLVTLLIGMVIGTLLTRRRRSDQR